MSRSWQTKLIHSDAEVPEGFRSLVTPVFRGSTTVFPNAETVRDTWRHDVVPYSYGLYGTPTSLELAARITELEHGQHTFLTPGGQAAIGLICFAFLRAGEHLLITDSVYGPTRIFANKLLARFGVEVEYYPSTIGADIEQYIKPNTRLIWCESPGSVTMEVQDVPAIAAAAHRHNAVVALDNTYSAGVYFDAFAHDVDVTMQAITKYIGGHSDLLLGSVTVRDTQGYERVGSAHDLLGLNASPDDCSLALRGMLTLAVRLRALEQSTLAVAKWLAERPEIERMLHPALPSCPGHEIWKRDFTGSTSVFSIVFDPRYSKEQLFGFVNALELFEIGYSWGGVTSLAVPMFKLARIGTGYGERLVRLNIGLEDPNDLIADIERALQTLA